MVAYTSARLDQTFEALSDEQRRRLLHYLSESSDGTATVEELTELLGGDPLQTELRLRHVHIPYLRDTTIIDYDDRTETIRYHGNPLVERVLDNCLEECSPCIR